MIKEFKAKVKNDKKNRIDIIKNRNFELLCYLNTKKANLINEIEILILELEFGRVII